MVSVVVDQYPVWFETRRIMYLEERVKLKEMSVRERKQYSLKRIASGGRAVQSL